VTAGSSNADVLSGVWLFAGLDRERLEKLATFTFSKSYTPGDSIVEEGRTGNGLYVITSGRVEVVKAFNTERATRLAVLEAGEFFGEMALLTEWPRSATVRAIEPTACVGIDRWLFLEQLRKDAQLAIVMLQALAKRLRETDDRVIRQG
jgi:CRP-like cAMP-binding protein